MDSFFRFGKLIICCCILFLSNSFAAAFVFADYSKNHVNTADIVSGELLIKFKPSLTRSKFYTKAKQYKAHRKTRLNHLGVEHWVLDESENLDFIIKKLQADPDVLVVEPNYRRYPRITHSNDTLVESNYPQNRDRLNEMNLPQLWEVEQTAYRKQYPVKIAVIDDAFDIKHIDLVDNIAAPYDAFANDDDPSPEICLDPTSKLSAREVHGTEVLGVVGAVSFNDAGIDGAADNALMIPIRISCNYTVAAEIRAFEYAIAQEVDIINISWGGPQFSEIERLGIVDLLKKDILIVVAAGNNELDNDKILDYPSGLNLPNILSVAAVDGNQTLAKWSQYGQTTVDVAAPGERITTLGLNDAYLKNKRGTSFSAPFVAGVAASLLARSTEGTSLIAIKAAIMESVTPFRDTLNARLVTDGYVDAFAAYVALTEPKPLPVISKIDIDDSKVPGNANGAVDLGEGIVLKIEIENIGVDANFLNAELSSKTLGVGTLGVDSASEFTGFNQNDFQYGRTVLEFPVDFTQYSQTQDVEFELKMISTYGDGEDKQTEIIRYFSVDTGSLIDGTPFNSIIRKKNNNQDELHYYHVTLDRPVDKLVIQLKTETQSEGLGLLIKYGSFPQFSFAEYKNEPSVGGFESGVLKGVESNGLETVTINRPDRGTYYIAVIAGSDINETDIAYTISVNTSTRSAQGCSVGKTTGLDPWYYLICLFAFWRISPYAKKHARQSRVRSNNL